MSAQGGRLVTFVVSAGVGVCVALGSPPASALLANGIWDANADFTLDTPYSYTEKFTLAGFLPGDGSGVTFTLDVCDASYTDYYESVTVGAAGAADAGKLVVTANSQGHVHAEGEPTACTVTATQGALSEAARFELYIHGPRSPPPMDLLAVQRTRSTTVTVRIPGGTHPWVRLRISKGQSGDSAYYLVRTVDPTTDLTFTALAPDTTYDITAARMNRPGFHLWGGSDDASAGVLTPATVPDAVWVSRLTGGGAGKPTAPLSVTTLPGEENSPDDEPDEPDEPEPVPALPMVAVSVLAAVLAALGSRARLMTRGRTARRLR